MYTAVIVIALLLPLLTVQAAPPKKHEPLRPILPKPNPLVAELVIIDPTCSSDPKKHLLVEQALSDAYDIAKMGEGIKPEDAAFKNYFISNSHEKPLFPNVAIDWMKQQYGATVPERIDTKMVPDMIKSILTGGGDKQKLTVRCPTLAQEKSCAHGFAFVVTNPKIHTMTLCPTFFDERAKNYLALKPFTPDGWCTPPPHHLSKVPLSADTIVHEMTHLMYITSYALLQSLPEAERSKNVLWHTRDIMGTPDENDVNNRHTYCLNDVLAARNLKQHWVAYLAQPNKATGRLKLPPLETADNAESYAAALIEYFFYVKCKAHGFDPTEVVV